MLRIEPDDVTAPDWPSLLDDAISGRLPLDIHFQPIVDVRRGVVCGYEALSRFPATLGLSPDRWFAAADALGVGAQLEARAVATILSHRPVLADNCFLSLNLSPDAACSPTVQQLLLDEHDLRGVVLEITERSPVEDYDALAEALAPLRALGATVAIDDAGAGLDSSMRHIVTLEPQFVKLDPLAGPGRGQRPRARPRPSRPWGRSPARSTPGWWPRAWRRPASCRRCPRSRCLWSRASCWVARAPRWGAWPRTSSG